MGGSLEGAAVLWRSSPRLLLLSSVSGGCCLPGGASGRCLPEPPLPQGSSSLASWRNQSACLCGGAPPPPRPRPPLPPRAELRPPRPFPLPPPVPVPRAEELLPSKWEGPEGWGLERSSLKAWALLMVLPLSPPCSEPSLAEYVSNETSAGSSPVTVKAQKSQPRTQSSVVSRGGVSSLFMPVLHSVAGCQTLCANVGTTTRQLFGSQSEAEPVESQ
mmetsp:Transcript_4039/g.11401  ORF Transcript_4039/g.11401 Transcript_4039/m.11401 type:complete len:217 (-) Transcript_4039:708-1358(-)